MYWPVREKTTAYCVNQIDNGVTNKLIPGLLINKSERIYRTYAYIVRENIWYIDTSHYHVGNTYRGRGGWLGEHIYIYRGGGGGGGVSNRLLVAIIEKKMCKLTDKSWSLMYIIIDNLTT